MKDMFEEILNQAEKIVADDAELGGEFYWAGVPRPSGHKLRDRTLQRGWDEAAASDRTRS